PLKTKKSTVCDDIYIYTSQAIENSDDIGLTRAGLVFVALVNGGDYHDGLKGFGIKTAIALAHCGFGDSLANAYRNLAEPELAAFLQDWRRSIRHELHSNSQGYMTNRNLGLAYRITESFPDLQVLKLYIDPLTSWSPGQLPPDTSRWYPHLPRLWLVAQFAVEHLFPTRRQYLKVFHKHLFPGMACRLITFGAPMYDAKTHHIHGLLADAAVTRIYPQPRVYTPGILKNSRNPQSPPMRSIHMKVTANKFIQLAGADPNTLKEDESDILADVDVWIPEFILRENIKQLLSETVHPQVTWRNHHVNVNSNRVEFIEGTSSLRAPKSDKEVKNARMGSHQAFESDNEMEYVEMSSRQAPESEDEVEYLQTRLRNGKTVKIVDTIEID
ncbi:hypothetical protein MPER_11636, partial [Moniliophthora perniciosa FA553]